VQLSPAQEAAHAAIAASFRAGGFAPPEVAAALAAAPGSDQLKNELLLLLTEEGALVRLAEGIFIHRDALSEARDKVKAELAANGRITVGTFRDLVGTSRKFALPILERFDAETLTRRVGDERLPGPLFVAEQRQTKSE
jgi:selenocysteine-specific elongation factor